MQLLQKLFARTPSQRPQAAPLAPDERVKIIHAHTAKLWQFLEETLAYYHSLSCQCAFPRFRQMAGIDCVDYRKSFYASETEGFIYKSKKYFHIRPLDKGPEAVNERWTCTTCGSIYDYGWADFSIHVNRTFLKIRELKAVEIGAGPKIPLPLFVGIFGHTLPDRTFMAPVDFDTWSAYIRETKEN